MKLYLEIGETFNHKGKKLVIERAGEYSDSNIECCNSVSGVNCDLLYEDCESLVFCMKEDRKDKTPVVFIEKK